MAFVCSSDVMSSSPHPGHDQEGSPAKCGRPTGRASIALDIEGRVVDWDSKAEALTEFRRQEVMGLHFVDKMLTQETQELVAPRIDDVVAGKPVRPLFISLYALSGFPSYVDLSIEPRYGEDGNRVGVMLFCSLLGGKELTRATDAEARTTVDLDNYCGDCDDDSEDEDFEMDAMGAGNDQDTALSGIDSNATILETHGGQIKIGLDSQGQIVEWGCDAEAITQFDSESVLGMHFVRRLLCTDGQAKVSSCIADAISGKCGQCCFVPFHTLSGEKLTVSFTIAPRFDEARAVTGAILSGEVHLRGF